MYSDIQGSPDMRKYETKWTKQPNRNRKKQTLQREENCFEKGLFTHSERQNFISMKQEQVDMKKDHSEYTKSWRSIGNQIQIQ